MDFKVGTERQADGTRIVAVEGELDMYTVPQLERQLFGVLDDNSGAVIVDLGECDFLDSTALGVLMTANRRAGYPHARLTLVATNHGVLRAFEITGLDRVFDFHPTRDSALNGNGHA